MSAGSEVLPLRALTRGPSRPSAARVYVARLRAGASVRSTEGSLVRAAELLGVELPPVGRIGSPDANVRAQARRAFAVDRVPWERLSPDHLRAVIARAEERFAPATAAHLAYVLRGVLRVAWTREEYPDRWIRNVDTIQPSTGGRKRMLRDPFTLPERSRLYRACPPGDVGRRDRALCALLDGCGLRRAEVCTLDRGDVAEGSLRVLGKGGRIRHVPLEGDVRDVLDKYLALRGDAPGPLLLPWTSRGPIMRRLRPDVVYRRLLWLTQRAGLRAMNPHTLRAGACGDLLDAGVDLSTVAAFVGHASTDTTRLYDRRGQRALRHAARTRTLPL